MKRDRKKTRMVKVVVLSGPSSDPSSFHQRMMDADEAEQRAKNGQVRILHQTQSHAGPNETKG